jgi:hypothetical protein
MGDRFEVDERAGLSRRSALKHIGAGAAIAWSTPAVLSVASGAAAGSPPPAPPAPGSADLSVTLEGEVFSFEGHVDVTTTVRNLGPDTAPNVVTTVTAALTNSSPPAMHVVDVVPSEGTCTAPSPSTGPGVDYETFVCSGISLATSESFQVTFRVVNYQNFEDAVRIDADAVDAAVSDPNTSNNHAFIIVDNRPEPG